MNLNEIIASDKQYYMDTFGARTPVAFEKGVGAVLTSIESKQYVDFLAGIAVTSLGHSHPAVTAALHAQIDKLIHCTNIYYIEKQAELEQLLVKGVAAKHGLTRMFMSNNGAEANECALKLARKYFYEKGETRTQIISMLHSFHGRTLATVAATGQEKYQKPYKPLMPGFVHVEFNDIGALKAVISSETCAVLLEVIQGEGGVIVGDPDYLAQVQALCHEYGALLIIDEIQTGIGRTGQFFGFESYDLEPDIITLAKALGNGVPIGCTIAREEVATAFHPGDHGGTFGGNPLACAAAIAVLNTMLAPGFLETVRGTGAYFHAKLNDIAAKHSCIVDVRGMGMMLGMQLAEAVGGKQVVADMFERGYLLNCAGMNTLRFVPPLIVSRAQIDAMCAELECVLP